MLTRILTQGLVIEVVLFNSMLQIECATDPTIRKKTAMTLEPPRETITDKIVSLSRAAVVSLPLGTQALALLDLVVSTPLQERERIWREEIALTLQELVDRDIDIDKLSQNQDFLDLILNILIIGTKSHQEEKRKALKAALKNSVLVKNIDFYKKSSFLQSIDSFSLIHINILTFIDNPRAYLKKIGRGSPNIGGVGTVESTILGVFTELKTQHDWLAAIWMDLYNRGFLSEDRTILKKSMNAEEPLLSRTTSLGKEFLKFITDEV